MHIPGIVRLPYAHWAESGIATEKGETMHMAALAAAAPLLQVPVLGASCQTTDKTVAVVGCCPPRVGWEEAEGPGTVGAAPCDNPRRRWKVVSFERRSYPHLDQS